MGGCPEGLYNFSFMEYLAQLRGNVQAGVIDLTSFYRTHFASFIVLVDDYRDIKRQTANKIKEVG